MTGGAGKVRWTPRITSPLAAAAFTTFFAVVMRSLQRDGRSDGQSFDVRLRTAPDGLRADNVTIGGVASLAALFQVGELHFADAVLLPLRKVALLHRNIVVRSRIEAEDRTLDGAVRLPERGVAETLLQILGNLEAPEGLDLPLRAEW